MSETINEMLRGHFTKNRIVFWYDRDAQNREIYESFDDPEIIKIELKNNEFAVKYRVLRLEPDKNSSFIPRESIRLLSKIGSSISR